MKKLLLILALVTMVVQSASASARVPITYGEHEKIEKVGTLPEGFTTDGGVQLDLGYKYTVFEIAFVPLWTTDEGKLVGYDTNDPDSYYDIDTLLEEDEVRAEVLSAAGVSELTDLYKMPFWDAWGGKLVALAVVALILYGIFGRDKKAKEPEVVAPAVEE